MGPLIRYVLLQVPGIFFLGIILYLLMDGGWLGMEAAVWIMVLWLIKDIALYPIYRPALTRREQGNAVAELEGFPGRARTEIDEEGGMVLVRGEFWRARAASKAIPAGTPVRVNGSRGRVLIVEVAEQSAPTSAK